MAGWLGHATSLFQQTPPPPDPFEVECDCGGKVVGRRLNVYQKPACPICERPVFVLPANVYPRPKIKPKSTASKRADKANAARSPTTLVVDDNPSATPNRLPARSTRAAGRVPQVASAADTSMLREPPTRMLTPLRMIATAIVLMSFLTVAGLSHRQRIENAKAIVLKAADAGMAALRQQEFGKAAQDLENARQAVDVLGRTDHAANDIRRFSREATTLAKLASSSLTELLQETLAGAKAGQIEPLRLSSTNNGAWVIFDAKVLPSTERVNRCVVDAPIQLAKAMVRIEIESLTLQSLSKANEFGEVPRLIFAAQLEQLSPPIGDPLTTVLTLNGKTAFLWTSYDTYAAVGYRPIDAESEQETRSLLERQLEAGK